MNLQMIIEKQVEAERQARWEADVADGRHPRLDASRSAPASDLTPWENLLPVPAAPPPDRTELLTYLDRNEVGDAELFRRLHADAFCHDASRDKWLAFSGVVWADDELKQSHSEVTQLADLYEATGKQAYLYYADLKSKVDEKVYDRERELTRLVESDAEADAMRKLKKEIDALKDEAAVLSKKANAAKKKYDQRASLLRAKNRSLNVLSMSAIGVGSMGRTGHEFDTHPNLLAFANGVVDLETGRLLRSSPGLYLTKVSQIAYPGYHAYSAWWDEHLQKIFCGNEVLLNYFETCIGYSATGLQVNKDIWVALGPQANNGKSVTFNAIKQAMGDVATTIKLDVLLEEKNRSKGPDPDLMVLDGIRMGLASEATAGVKFSMERIKTITGGDDVRARAMYADSKIIQTKVKLWLHTNEVPQISGYDPGFMLRLRIIPFLARFVNKPEDVDIAAHCYPALGKFEVERELRAAYPAIAAWIVRCARKFMLNMNYATPPIVLDKTKEYFEEQDIVGEFISARCLTGSGYQSGSAQLHKAFVAWCKEAQGMNEKQIWSNKRLSGELKKRGYAPLRIRPTTIFGGIQPLAD